MKKSINFIKNKIIFRDILVYQMFLNKKGQTDPKWIIYVVIACVISVLILGLWSWFTQQSFPTDPESYVRSWEEYGEYAFDWSGDDQPWRLLAIFFFPLIIYFTIFFAAICLVFAKGNLGQGWDVVQKPFVVFSFAVAFMILPTPITFVLYQSLGGISIIVLLFSWATALGFIFILFNYMSKHFSLGDSGRRRDTSSWFQGRKEKEESDVDKLRREANGLINETRKFMGDCNNVIQKKDKDSAVSYMTFINKLGERIDNLINEIEGSELPDYEKFSYRRTLEPLTGQLEKLYERLDELKGKEETTEEEKKEKNEKILNDLINVAKKTEEAINKLKKEEFPEDLRKDAEKIEDLRKKLEQTENYEERVKIGIELQELLKSFTGKSEEGEKQVEKEEEKKKEDGQKKEDKFLSEFYELFKEIEKAAKVNRKHLNKLSGGVIKDKACMTSKLREKCKNLVDKNTKLIKFAGEVKHLFKSAETFERAVEQFHAKGYFPEMKSAVVDVLSATEDLKNTFIDESQKKKKVEIESGKFEEMTYRQAHPDIYNSIFPDLLKDFADVAAFLSDRYNQLYEFFRESAKKE